uniref:DUF1446 domain-containing protein n=1 Tax=Schlesneria paludicola TaxID=360056 RepID=A0A7C2K0B7_9PLAN
MRDRVRIGNAHAFWGDRSDAALEILTREPDLDFLTLDYLAEVSMSILAMQRERDPARGYARDFVDLVRSLAPYWAAGGRCRLIANAGGLTPAACAADCARVLAEAGCRRLKIAVVSGDDVLDLVRASRSAADGNTFENLDTGEPISRVADRLVTANAYLGAAPIAQALHQGADIVITGRVADPSLTVAPCLHHFGWTDQDWSRIAGATVAGHLIECGTQVTGGLWTDWLEIPDPANIGFPIVEIASDGSCVVTKPGGTGGCVNEWTVKEQLVYEIGDPGRYVSPDVLVSFLSLTVEEIARDRVRVSGAVGQPPPPTLKVSATYRDGFRAAGTLTVFGRDAVAKAQRSGDVILQRLRGAGHVYREALVECLAAGACGPAPLAGANAAQLVETVLRIAVESDSRAAVEQFSRELMSLITAGPPGTTGYAEGRPRVHPVFRYWPCLIDRARVAPRLEWIETAEVTAVSSADTPQIESARRVSPPAPGRSPERTRAAGAGTLHDWAYARSGDKGTNANIGVIARRRADYPFLAKWLTVERVREYFRSMGVEAVDRYELPNLQGLNFVVHGILRSGLRTDAQGKALAQALLEMPVPDVTTD